MGALIGTWTQMNEASAKRGQMEQDYEKAMENLVKSFETLEHIAGLYDVKNSKSRFKQSYTIIQKLMDDIYKKIHKRKK